MTLPAPPEIEELDPPIRRTPQGGTPGLVSLLMVMCFILGALGGYVVTAGLQRTPAPVVQTVTPQSCITALAEADKDFQISARAVEALSKGDVAGSNALFASIDIQAYLDAKAACRG